TTRLSASPSDLPATGLPSRPSNGAIFASAMPESRPRSSYRRIAVNQCPVSETDSIAAPSLLTASPDQPPKSLFGEVISIPPAHESFPVLVSFLSSGFQSSGAVETSTLPVAAIAVEIANGGAANEMQIAKAPNTR